MALTGNIPGKGKLIAVIGDEVSNEFSVYNVF